MTKKKRQYRATPVREEPKKRRGVAAFVIGGSVVVAAVVAVLVSGASAPSHAQTDMREMAKSFNAASNVTVAVTGGGRAGTLTVSFDGQGGYESVVSGTPNAVANGTLLAVGGREYTKAGAGALYNTMAKGSAPLPVSRARLYATRYGGVWLNMGAAPSVAPMTPAHTNAQEFLSALGGSWAAVGSATGQTVSGARLVKIRAGADTWLLDSSTKLPVALMKDTKHGVVKFSFSYDKVVALSAPAHSQIPPLPVNTSLSPQNYPLVLDPFTLVYTTLVQFG